MTLHGQNLIGGKPCGSQETFAATNPAAGTPLTPLFCAASTADVDRAATLASEAFEDLRKRPATEVADFLERIAAEIMNLGDELLTRAHAETALPIARLTGERGRTFQQIKLFADLVREGSWVEAAIDRAIPDRAPAPKPDLRRMLIPLGPVAVFSASNFPLAFSVAGGDTISALAAKNPVIVKAHRGHPGTSELVGRAIATAAETAKFHPGVFALLHTNDHETALNLVRAPAIKAVGFTGSLGGGRALFDAAVRRPEPVPVYAEMGSTNPVFILPGALKARAETIAQGLVQAVTLGVGQFCTNPGLVFAQESPSLQQFIQKTGELASTVAPGTMLFERICRRFHETAEEFTAVPGVETVGRTATKPATATQASAIIFTVTGDVFAKSQVLRDEMFGPSTLIIRCANESDLEKMAMELPGQLTATIHATDDDRKHYAKLLSILEQKAGRVIFNGFPTGVEVCPSMHHGGPYPATTDSHFTSVGTSAIKRFARPVCYQNFPEADLPVELQNKNSRNIWRLIDGKLTRDDS